MKLLVPIVLVSLLTVSCGSSRIAVDSAPQNNSTSDASANTDAATNSSAQQPSDKTPTLQDNSNRVYRQSTPEEPRTITETK